MSVKISRSIRPVLNLPLPWEKVWPHYRRWSRTAQGENAVVSYLLAHPKFLVSELKKRKILVPELHLGGTEVVFPKKKGEKGRYRKADLIYRSGKNFIVVEAKENDCSPDLWLELARRREVDHPADAVPIYEKQVEVLVARKNNDAYAEAAALVWRVRSALWRLRQASDFTTYLEDLKARHRRLRNFSALLREVESEAP